MKKKYTLTDVIIGNKNSNNGIFFIEEGKDKFVSYKQLYEESLNILYFLQKKGIKKGQELIFQIKENENFIYTFWACILGGIIPVPITVGNNDEHKLKFFKIWEILTNPFLIINDSRIGSIEEYATNHDLKNTFHKIEKKLVTVEESMSKSNIGKPEIHSTNENDIAFIQFSSGSTGNPKGVILTHKNLTTNIKGIIEGMKINSFDSFLSWMPLTHDLGLIGMHIVPVYMNINDYIIPTIRFVRRPIVWVEKISEYNVSISSSPNFGYKYLLTNLKGKKLDNLNLTSLRIMINGAEPISISLCEEFLTKFYNYGLKRSSMFTVYGMAEATLAISFPPINQEFKKVNVDRRFLNIGKTIVEVDESENKISFADEGYPLNDCNVRICDLENNELHEKIIGEVQIKGDNVTNGYYNNIEENKEVFTYDGWLKTGDLGFFYNGRLVIIGRLKDVIIINGQNYYSHDLEKSIEHIPDAELGKVVILGVYSEIEKEDEVIVFILDKRKDKQWFLKVADEIKKNILLKIGISVKWVIPVDKIPKTTSGKLQRFILKEKYLTGDYDQIINEIKVSKNIEYDSNVIKKIIEEKNNDKILELLSKIVEKVLGYRIDEHDKNLVEAGITSIKVPQLQKTIEECFNIDIPISLVFDYPTLNKLSLYISKQFFIDNIELNQNYNGNKNRFQMENNNTDIAIIGMACRFPGGINSPQKFWKVLYDGLDVIEEIPAERWDFEKYYDESGKIPGKMITKYGGFLNNVDKFDSVFFGISANEAKYLDPQQRILSEVCYEVLENAGLNITDLNESKTGVFIGASSHDYLDLTMQGEYNISPYTVTGNMFSTISGRISYIFGFQGPTMTIDTACSSSLVAIDQAILNLINNKCNLALAGGVNLILTPNAHIGFSQLGALAPDGRCKSFDNNANGYVRSEGCGVILLKRFSDAVKDNDTIMVVISSSSINHDGRSSGLSVPNGLAQEAVIKDAINGAKISINDLDYIEAHGSGTKLGDPQEVNSLTSVFKNRDRNLIIGSVKTNIGHTESAAGIAGVIKVILALNNEVIPKSLHFNIPNDLIPWDKIPISVASENIEWPKSNKTRIAGVSSFGISGTNAHLIIKESGVVKKISKKKDNLEKCLTISTKDQITLKAMIKDYKKFILETEENITDICFTSNISRASFDYKAAFIGKTKEELLKKIDCYLTNHEENKGSRGNNPKIVFLFTGQGSIYGNIARELYNLFPIFKQELDICDNLFKKYFNYSIIKVLYENEIQEIDLNNPIYSQPITFSIEYALSKLWISWGIKPSMIIGHSIGEYAAACIAGIFNLEYAVRMVFLRSEVVQQVKVEGKMVGVLANHEKIKDILQEYSNYISVAAINAFENITISGEKIAIENAINKIKKRRIFIEELNISHAFHSILMKSYINVFKEKIKDIEFLKPQIRIISTILAKVVNNEMSNSDYWSQHIYNTVNFYDSVKLLEKDDYNLFIEIGSSATLSGLASQIIENNKADFFPSLRPDVNSWSQILTSLSKLYTRGYYIDWKIINQPFTANKIILPNYPFRKEKYWIKKSGKDYDKILYEIEWQEEILGINENKNLSQDAFFIFSDEKGVGDKIDTILSCKKYKSIKIYNDRLNNMAVHNSDCHYIDKSSIEGIIQFLSDTVSEKHRTNHIIYMGGLNTIATKKLNHEILFQEQKSINSELLNIIKAVNELQYKLKINFKLWVITKNAQTINAKEKEISVGQSVLWGFGRTIETEFPNLWGGLIDIDDFVLNHNINAILDEINYGKESQICLRENNKRLIARLVNKKNSVNKSIEISKNKTYLITGAFGKLGIIFTEWLISKGATSFLLIGRSDPNDHIKENIKEYISQGISIQICKCDISKENDIKNAISMINQLELPQLAGVIHAAGVISDNLIVNQEWKSFYNVFASKVLGTWNLHLATKNLSLDFFIMFSSMSSLLGVEGQSNYAAANEFMNTLAWYRRNNNLPAMSICWSLWSELGMNTSNDLANYYKNTGINYIKPEDGKKIFEKLLKYNPIQIGVFDTDFNIFLSNLFKKERNGVFTDFITIDYSDQHSIVLDELKNVLPIERNDILTNFLRKEISMIMGYTNHEKVNINKPLMLQGIDSLMSVQLKNKLTRELGISLSATVLFAYPTIAKLSKFILSNVLIFQDNYKTLESNQKKESISPGNISNLLNEIDHILEQGE